jgi:hypothetical protein
MGQKTHNHEKKFGEFLVEEKLISQSQLNDALDLQRFNRERLIGEILVTQGTITKEQLIMAMEMYLMVTGSYPSHVDEWLDQDEIDMILERLHKK